MADEISFLPLGAIIQSFKVGGVDIVQGFPTQAQYEALEASTGRRQRRGLSAEMRRLMRQREVKRDQIYDLHDVLEGQRAGGLDMSAQDLEVTIASVLSRDETWNGIVD